MLMLFKWITCEVPLNQRQSFSEAQIKWEPIKKLKGFCFQLGGFKGDEAHLFALWESVSAYEAFMANEHDRIYRETGQKGTYDRIFVHTFSIDEVKGTVDEFKITLPNGIVVLKKWDELIVSNEPFLFLQKEWTLIGEL